jgi:hypothetical protein
MLYIDTEEGLRNTLNDVVSTHTEYHILYDGYGNHRPVEIKLKRNGTNWSINIRLIPNEGENPNDWWYFASDSELVEKVMYEATTNYFMRVRRWKFYNDRIQHIAKVVDGVGWLVAGILSIFTIYVIVQKYVENL